MEYSVGTTGRIIAARLFEGEDIYESVETIARAEDIKSAAVLITGGLREANVVVGPKQEEPEMGKRSALSAFFFSRAEKYERNQD